MMNIRYIISYLIVDEVLKYIFLRIIVLKILMLSGLEFDKFYYIRRLERTDNGGGFFWKLLMFIYQ